MTGPGEPLAVHGSPHPRDDERRDHRSSVTPGPAPTATKTALTEGRNSGWALDNTTEMAGPLLEDRFEALGSSTNEADDNKPPGTRQGRHRPLIVLRCADDAEREPHGLRQGRVN